MSYALSLGAGWIDCKDNGSNAEYMITVQSCEGDEADGAFFVLQAMHCAIHGVVYARCKASGRFQAAYVVAIIPRSNTGPFAVV